MSRAKRLLVKTRHLEDKIRNYPYKSRQEVPTLDQIPEVEKIEYKKPAPKKEPVPVVEKIVVEEVTETVVEKEEIVSFDTVANSIMRIDYRFPNEDMGLEVTLPEGIITASGLQPGDYLEILDGELEGRSLEVIEVLNATTLRLDDVHNYGKAEENCKVKFSLNS